MAKTNSGMPYQSFGDLRIAFPGHTRYTNYYRELSLDSARTLVRYEVDGVQYRRETITSFTDQVIMVRLTANRPGRITFNAQLTSPHQDVVITSEEGNCVTLSGVSSLHEGLKGKVEFQGRLTARNTGGRMTCADGVLSVEGADEAIVYVSIATNFNNYQDITGNPAERAKDYLRWIAKKHLVVPVRSGYLSAHHGKGRDRSETVACCYLVVTQLTPACTQFQEVNPFLVFQE